MSEHFNIQISIQRVASQESGQTAYRGLGKPQDPLQQRKRFVTDVADIKLTAESEREAFARAHKLLAAAEPEWPVQFKAEGETKPQPHLHRASCHGPMGELQCGFPSAASIANQG